MSTNTVHESVHFGSSTYTEPPPMHGGGYKHSNHSQSMCMNKAVLEAQNPLHILAIPQQPDIIVSWGWAHRKEVEIKGKAVCILLLQL